MHRRGHHPQHPLHHSRPSGRLPVVRIALEGRDAVNQPGTPLMNEELRGDAVSGVPEQPENGSPAVDPACECWPEEKPLLYLISK
jgi:hypothetical protein